MKLIFSSVFKTDFAGGVEYLACEANKELATRWENSVYRTIAPLKKHLQLGRLQRDLQPSGIGTFSVKGFPHYLVFCTTNNKELVLLRVKHGAMNLHALFAT